MNYLPDQKLTADQLITLTRAMLSVALVDEIQPAEAHLICQFYEASRNANMPTCDAIVAGLEAQPFTVSELAQSSSEFVNVLMPLCVMTAYADGHLSAGELEHLKCIAATANVNPQRFEAHLGRVRDELVSAISHLPDAGSVAVVVKELRAIS